VLANSRQIFAFVALVGLVRERCFFTFWWELPANELIRGEAKK
jgi:hypothetical protein